MKKILCVLLSLLMLVSFTSVAFAEDEPVEIPEKTLEELLALLLDAESVVPMKILYSEESWEVFIEAYNAAWAATAVVGITNAELGVAYANLVAASDALEESTNFFIALFHNIIQYIISKITQYFGDFFVTA